MGKSRTIKVDWERFSSDIYILADKVVKNGFHPDYVLAILFGGRLGGKIIAQFLRVTPKFVVVQSYDGRKKGSLRVDKDSEKILKEVNGNILIFDDLIDTGDTVNFVVDRLKKNKRVHKVKVATLYHKPHSPKPDFVVKEIKGWIQFPWETE